MKFWKGKHVIFSISEDAKSFYGKLKSQIPRSNRDDWSKAFIASAGMTVSNTSGSASFNIKGKKLKQI